MAAVAEQSILAGFKRERKPEQMPKSSTAQKSAHARWVESRLADAMQFEEVDAVVAVSPENVAYVAGYTVPSQALGVRNRFFAAVVTLSGRSAMILSANELREAEQRAQVDQLIAHDEFNDDPIKVLLGVLGDLGLDPRRSRIGLEFDALPVDRWMALLEYADRAAFTNGTPCFAAARTVKSLAETELLRSAARIADAAQEFAHTTLKGNVTERDVARAISDAAMGYGADAIKGIQVAAGERSSLSNAAPTDRELQNGELVKVDNFFVKGSYLSDTGRSFSVGDPSPAQSATWNAIQDARMEILASIRPGVSTRDVWATFVDAFEARKLNPAIRFLGHGLGLSLHEEPFIAAHTDTTIEEGMVLAIEPIAQVGDVKFFVEDNLTVGPDGIDLFTDHFGARLPVMHLGG